MLIFCQGGDRTNGETGLRGLFTKASGQTNAYIGYHEITVLSSITGQPSPAEHADGRYIFCNSSLKIKYTEKRVLGIILSLLGVIGLIMAAVNFMNGGGAKNVKEIIIYGILGAIFFFAGIGLVRSTKDKPT